MSAGYRGIPMPAPSVPTPRGLQAIYATLKQIYPDQPNPLQVTALVKYWLVYLQVNHVVTYALTGSQYAVVFSARFDAY